MLRMTMIAALSLTLSTQADASGANARLALEYNVGEELMNDCVKRKKRCGEWLKFKREWEEGVDYLTTFEKSLKRWRRRNP